MYPLEADQSFQDEFCIAGGIFGLAPYRETLIGQFSPEIRILVG